MEEQSLNMKLSYFCQLKTVLYETLEFQGKNRTDILVFKTDETNELTQIYHTSSKHPRDSRVTT